MELINKIKKLPIDKTYQNIKVAGVHAQMDLQVRPAGKTVVANPLSA